MKNLIAKGYARVIACLLMAVLLFTGCGAAQTKTDPKDSSPADQPSQSTDSSAALSEPVTIRIFNRVNAQVVIENNPVLKEVERIHNIKIEYEAPPINNYVEKLQIVMASGDLPDLIYNWGVAGNGADANMEIWASNGLLAVLDDKIVNYPNLMSNITKEMWDAVRSVNDGKIYIVPRTNIVNHWGYMINQEWLDKLNLKAPTTLDEFTHVCREFTFKDPDGNGEQDTYGVTFSNPQLGANTIWNSTYFLASAFNLPIINGAKDTDGNYKIREKMSGYIPYLTYLKQLYEEKIIDPEFLINKIYADQEKQNQNRVGIRYAHQYAVVGNTSKVEDSHKRFTYHPPLKNSEGVAIDYVTPAMWGGWMISSSCKHIDVVLKLLDWGNTAEANTLFQIGIEGVHYQSYDPENKMVTRTKEQAEAVATVTSTYMTFANAINGSGAVIEGADTLEKYNKYKTDLENALKQVTTVNLPAVRAPKILNLNSTIPDLVKKKDDYEIGYIIGKISLEQFKDFLEKEWYPAVADAEQEYIEEMKKLDR